MILAQEQTKTNEQEKGPPKEIKDKDSIAMQCGEMIFWGKNGAESFDYPYGKSDIGTLTYTILKSQFLTDLWT